MLTNDALEGYARLLTVTEVADILRVSRGTIYRIIANGSLPGVIKLSATGNWRVDSGKLEAWIAKQNGGRTFGGG